MALLKVHIKVRSFVTFCCDMVIVDEYQQRKEQQQSFHQMVTDFELGFQTTTSGTTNQRHLCNISGFADSPDGDTPDIVVVQKILIRRWME